MSTEVDPEVGIFRLGLDLPGEGFDPDHLNLGPPAEAVAQEPAAAVRPAGLILPPRSAGAAPAEARAAIFTPEAYRPPQLALEPAEATKEVSPVYIDITAEREIRDAALGEKAENRREWRAHAETDASLADHAAEAIEDFKAFIIEDLDKLKAAVDEARRKSLGQAVSAGLRTDIAETEIQTGFESYEAAVEREQAQRAEFGFLESRLGAANTEFAARSEDDNTVGVRLDGHSRNKLDATKLRDALGKLQMHIATSGDGRSVSDDPETQKQITRIIQGYEEEYGIPWEAIPLMTREHLINNQYSNKSIRVEKLADPQKEATEDKKATDQARKEALAARDALLEEYLGQKVVVQQASGETLDRRDSFLGVLASPPVVNVPRPPQENVLAIAQRAYAEQGGIFVLGPDNRPALPTYAPVEVTEVQALSAGPAHRIEGEPDSVAKRLKRRFGIGKLVEHTVEVE